MTPPPPPAREPRSTLGPASGQAEGLSWALRLSGLGLEIAGCALLGLLADRWLGTKPWLTVVGCFVGMAAALVHLIALVKPAATAAARHRSER